MYEQFYGLNESPFKITPNPDYLFLSNHHKEALASLLYGITEKKGFIVLTGEIGSGKTTLCRALLSQLPSNTKIALILNSYLNEMELLRTINEEFVIQSNYDTKKGLIDELNVFLLEEKEKGNTVVLILDEAQNFTTPALEQIRMLSNLETETDKLIQIVMVGQPELSDVLQRPELEQLNQRIAVRYHITPLDVSETMDYIYHRLEVARAKINIVFTPKAGELIYKYSRGVPRKINILCDRALLIGYTQSSFIIDENIIKQSISELEERPAKKQVDESNKTPSILKIAGVFLFFLIIFLSGIGILYNSSTIPQMKATEEPPQATMQNAQESNSGNEPEDQQPVNSANEITSSAQPIAMEQNRQLYNWEYDENKIARISNPELSLQAANITLLRLWRKIVDISNFSTLSVIEIKQLNIFQEIEGLGLNKAIIPERNLKNILIYNMPCVITLRREQNSIRNTNNILSPYVVIAGRTANDEALIVFDPVIGRVIVDSRQLQGHWQGIATFLYQDELNLHILNKSEIKGEVNQSVLTLKRMLRERGFYDGDINGIYDYNLTQGLKKFQRFYGISGSGNLDQKTILMIASLMNRQETPELMQIKGD